MSKTAAIALDAKSLRELGVDFKVTKDELINLVVEEQLEAISAEVTEVKEEHRILRDSLYSKAEVVKAIKVMDLPKHVRWLYPNTQTCALDSYLIDVLNPPTWGFDRLSLYELADKL